MIYDRAAAATIPASSNDIDSDNKGAGLPEIMPNQSSMRLCI